VTALTDAAESRVLNFVSGNAGATAPTLPLKVRLMTANGSDSAGGTEVVGGTYTPQSFAPGAWAAGAPLTNATDIVFTGMPACTVRGAEVWDSAGSPFRWAWGPAAIDKAVNAGDNYVIPAGSLTMPAA
jgi:hypothetical protein